MSAPIRVLGCKRGHKPDLQNFPRGDLTLHVVACVHCGAVTGANPTKREAVEEWNDDDAKFWNRTTTQGRVQDSYGTMVLRKEASRKIEA